MRHAAHRPAPLVEEQQPRPIIPATRTSSASPASAVAPTPTTTSAMPASHGDHGQEFARAERHVERGRAQAPRARARRARSPTPPHPSRLDHRDRDIHDHETHVGCITHSTPRTSSSPRGASSPRPSRPSSRRASSGGRHNSTARPTPSKLPRDDARHDARAGRRTQFPGTGSPPSSHQSVYSNAPTASTPTPRSGDRAVDSAAPRRTDTHAGVTRPRFSTSSIRRNGYRRCAMPGWRAPAKGITGMGSAPGHSRSAGASNCGTPGSNGHAPHRQTARRGC